MALTPGTTIGTYEVTALIGQGGMGEVYQARDTKLDRDVALKVLPEAFTADPDRLARFEREAKVLASLNHPNIGSIYGLEEAEGVKALVLELVEGPTLADRIKQGPIPLDEALPIAKQIAEALEAAHEQGVIHRDLKPANIKVKDDGTVKVLDFGLAKALEPSPDVDPSQSPTLTAAATQMGVILGTAAYMSPEQARGKPVDKRSDIWAFGAVLFEMLTGQRAFDGDDVSLTLSLVLQHEPAWNLLPSDISPSVSVFLRRCLAKDATQRVHDIADVRLALTGGFEVATGVLRASSDARFVHRWRPASSVAALVLSAALGGIVVWVSTQGIDRTTTTIQSDLSLTIVPPLDAPLPEVGSLSSTPEISPDGSAVLFAGSGGLYVRRLDSLAAVHVPGSERASNAPFWSADSASVFYPATSRGGLIRVRMPDGAPELTMPLPGFSRAGSENATGALLVSSLTRLFFQATPGGTVQELAIPELGFGQVSYPEFLPDGRTFIFFWMPSERDEGEVYLASLDDGEVKSPTLLMTNDTAARYTPAGGGRLLFVRGDNLYSRQLDLVQRALVGESQVVEDRVGSGLGGVQRAAFSISRAGLIAWRAGVAALSQVTAYNRDGSVVSTTGPPLAADVLRLSPDETRLLAVDADRTWLLDVGRPGRLDLGLGIDWWFWSPDGSNLIGTTFIGAAGRGRGRLVERAVAGGEVRELGTYRGLPQDLSPDGTHVLLMAGGQRVRAGRSGHSGGGQRACRDRTWQGIYLPLPTDAGSSMGRGRACLCSRSPDLDCAVRYRTFRGGLVGAAMVGRSSFSIVSNGPCTPSPSPRWATTSRSPSLSCCSWGFGLRPGSTTAPARSLCHATGHSSTGRRQPSSRGLTSSTSGPTPSTRTTAHGFSRWHKSRPVFGHRQDWRRRDGGGVSGPRHHARARQTHGAG